ncbi:MucR family transcriptional regulator [Methylobacterium aquaticum]|jgi:predicted transcriptional regulator|uniref:MucR family transcriptional regulator n=1 Tax=Methylobacterium aquaticum TaxID=270351 RepID=A0A0J6SKZ7_9HYPH|nr:MucR family transcriptional regulator [Methylobacterium aquaticum]KMO34292.1 hypothetical protein VP06_14560 [Methylobacterium aquaticum]
MTEANPAETGDKSPVLNASIVADLVMAYLSNHHVPIENVPEIFQTMEDCLKKVGAPPPEPVIDTKRTPSEIKKSITPDGITSFLDGKVYKSLKRHLTTRGMTPDEYRQKFGLPVDYPMVCTSYSAARSELARSMGLGQQRTKAARRRAA